ncbi:MAG: PQQ-binding-like beta-propeller repeat protein [Pirellulaceae bacterium]|nr:PQQ-binding-like beta-propeller repeat protein [Pirellulaceae bacterium]
MRLVLLSVSLAMLPLPAISPAADSVPATSSPNATLGSWNGWRGPKRDGQSPDVGLLKDWSAKPPSLAWTADGLGAGYASISLADGQLYTTGNFPDGQKVTALDPVAGKVVWSTPITDAAPGHKHEGSRSTPAIDGDRLYVVASSGKIVCLKTKDGSVVWARDFADFGGKLMSGWGFSESPLVDGDRVLCTPGGADALVVALDKLTGKDLWRAAGKDLGTKGKDGAGYSSMVVSEACGVRQYVQLVGRGVVGIRASDGKLLWNYNDVANGTANIPTPLVSGDQVFCSTGYRTGSALLTLTKDGDGIKCAENYFLSGEKLQNHHGGMILKDGYVYCGHAHNSGFPICVEMATGKIAWGGDQRGPGSGSAAVTYADGHLVFRYQSGEVALIEATPSGYHLKGSFKPVVVGKNPCWAHPVVIGGKLYLRDQDKLMCYDVRE